MNLQWFRRWGWFYRPVTVQGWVLVALELAFCTQVFRAIDAHSHSASDTLYGIFPYVACSLLLLNGLARKTSGEP